MLYGKISPNLYTGQYQGKPLHLAVIPWLISNADWHGYVNHHYKLISFQLGIPEDTLLKVLAELESPSPESRMQVCQGRFITRIDADKPWGWHIVNFAYYRDISSQREKADKEAARKAEWRHKQAQADAPTAPEPAQKPEPKPEPTAEELNRADGNGGVLPLGKQFTLEECRAAAEHIGMAESMIVDFYQHYKMQGWRLGNQLPMVDLSCALARWKQRALNELHKGIEANKHKRKKLIV